MKKCKTKYCRNQARKASNYCSTCSGRKYRERHKLKYAYQTLKDNAKRRNKVFAISFEYFAKFATEVDYLAKKGIKQTSWHIDRIKEELGYIEGNLQLLQNKDNVKKFLRWKHDGRGVPVDFYTHTEKISTNQDDCPF